MLENFYSAPPSGVEIDLISLKNLAPMEEVSLDQLCAKNTISGLF